MSAPPCNARGFLCNRLYIRLLRDSHVHNHSFLSTKLVSGLSLSLSAMPATYAATNGSASGKRTPASTVPPSPVSKPLETERAVTHGSGKPDKNAHDAEQERIKSEIDALQAKLVCCIPSSSLL